MTITQRLGRLITAAFVAFVLGGLILIAGAPHARAEEPPPTVWQAWIMPQVGDWDQIVASEENLSALPCGTTWRIQNDEYLPAERDRFVADGILHYGEDFQNEYQRGAISWFFSEHVTAPCVPEQPADEPYATSSQGTPDCVTRTVSTQTVTGFYGFTLVDNVWVRNPEPTITSDVTTTREATAEECPVVAPPTDKPPVAETPVTIDEPVVTASVNESILAETGAAEDRTRIGGAVAATLLLGGIAALIITRRLRERNEQK